MSSSFRIVGMNPNGLYDNPCRLRALYFSRYTNTLYVCYKATGFAVNIAIIVIQHQLYTPFLYLSRHSLSTAPFSYIADPFLWY